MNFDKTKVSLQLWNFCRHHSLLWTYLGKKFPQIKFSFKRVTKIFMCFLQQLSQCHLVASFCTQFDLSPANNHYNCQQSLVSCVPFLVNKCCNNIFFKMNIERIPMSTLTWEPSNDVDTNKLCFGVPPWWLQLISKRKTWNLMILHGIALYCMVFHYIAWYFIVLHCTIVSFSARGLYLVRHLSTLYTQRTLPLGLALGKTKNNAKEILFD